MLAPTFKTHYNEVPILKTVALEKTGMKELLDAILHLLQKAHLTDKRFWLLAEKAFFLIEQKRMKGVDKVMLKKEIEAAFQLWSFNLYQFVAMK